MPFRYPSPLDRLLAHSVKDPESDCWLWTGSRIIRNNRPRIAVRLGGRPRWITVTRFIVQFVLGKRWQAGRPKINVGAHICHNGQCVNPAHVRRRSQKQNINECVNAGRHRNGKTPRA